MSRKHTHVGKENRGGLTKSRETFMLSEEEIALIEHRVFDDRILLEDAVKGFPRTGPIITLALKDQAPDIYYRAIGESKVIRRERRREITSEPWYGDSCTLFWSPKLLIQRGYLKASGANKD
nr:hypothetical protein [uncultured Porphyromonas sp.]